MSCYFLMAFQKPEPQKVFTKLLGWREIQNFLLISKYLKSKCDD
jgi:hypothetical protein